MDKIKLLLIGLCCLIGVSLQAQKKDLIYLEHADALSFDKGQSADYQVLVGNVQFRHDSAWMYCDTAHFYQANNSLYAFGNVHIVQGDTLTIDGKYLHYEGDKKLVKMRQNVVMRDKEARLYTDNLDYDRNTNIGYYTHGGHLIDSINDLRSVYGQYNSSTKMAVFRQDVELVQTDMRMTTETLNYHVEDHVASIVSHSIIYLENGTIHAFRGWYDTDSGHSELFDRSYLLSSPYHMIGDTVKYQQDSGIGQAWGHVQMTDTSRSVRLESDYAYYDQEQEYALVTRNALLKEFSNAADTLFLHGDTLLSQKDSTYDTFRIYHHVRGFRSNVQWCCDSMYYTSRDSTLDLLGTPILWSEDQQVRGMRMKLYIKNSNPDYLYVEQNANSVQQEPTDSSYFNQCSGDELKAYFENQQLHFVSVEGNAQAIYLPHNEKGEMIALVRIENGDIYLSFDEEGQMKDLLVKPEPKGRFIPLDRVTSGDKYLPLFTWEEELRPKNAQDVFRRTDTQTTDSAFQDKSSHSGSGAKRSTRGRQAGKERGTSRL